MSLYSWNLIIRFPNSRKFILNIIPDPKKIETITKTLIDKFTKFKTTVHRSHEASAATANSDINDNNVNVANAIELD